jgi:hypothetical protein
MKPMHLIRDGLRGSNHIAFSRVVDH